MAAVLVSDVTDGVTAVVPCMEVTDVAARVTAGVASAIYRAGVGKLYSKRSSLFGSASIFSVYEMDRWTKKKSFCGYYKLNQKC